MSSKPLTAREGDVLVVSYPEVRVPVAPYSTVGVGNLIYTRKLVEGDDVQAEHDRIYSFLKESAEGTASAKIATWHAEIHGTPKATTVVVDTVGTATPPKLPPKPAGTSAPTAGAPLRRKVTQ